MAISFIALFDREVTLVHPMNSVEMLRVSRINSWSRHAGVLRAAHRRLGSLWSRLLYLDTKTYLVGDILTKVDRMSMATSLEVRVPMLDHDFVEWATGLPYRMKLRDNERKIHSEETGRTGWSSGEEAALSRKRQGFAMPLVHWMKHELKELIMSALLDSRTLQRGYFKPAAVRQLFDEHFRGYRDHSGPIWRLLMLELWHRNFLDKQADLAGSTTSLTGAGR